MQRFCFPHCHRDSREEKREERERERERVKGKMSTATFGFIAGIVLGLSLGMAGLFDNPQICVSMQRNDVYETSAPSLFHRMLQRPIDVPKEDDAYGVSHGKQHYLWITPVSVWKLRNSEKMNRDIYERVRKGYSSFKS